MKKIFCLFALAIAIIGTPCFAAHGGPHGGRGGHGGMHGHGGHVGGRPAMHAGVSMGHIGGGHGPSMGHRPPMHVGGGHRPHGVGMPPRHHVGHHRPLPPPIHRPYRPYLRPYYPYYYSTYYPYYTTSYSYYPATSYVYDPVVTTTPVTTAVNGVVVRDPYVNINTAANVINAAANVATMVRYWTW